MSSLRVRLLIPASVQRHKILGTRARKAVNAEGYYVAVMAMQGQKREREEVRERREIGFKCELLQETSEEGVGG